MLTPPRIPSKEEAAAIRREKFALVVMKAMIAADTMHIDDVPSQAVKTANE